METRPTRDALHYSLLFAPRPYARQVRAATALATTLYAIPQGCSQLAPALARLRWWQEELRRLGQGQPEHPASRALHTLAGPTFDPQPWQDLLIGLQTQLTAEPPLTLEQGWQAALAAGGALEQQYARWQGLHAPAALAAAARLGAARHLWHTLVGLRSLTALGCCPLPQTLLRTHQLHAARLRGEPQAGAAALGALLTQLRQELIDCLPHLGGLDQRIRADLLLSLIHEVATDAALLLTHQVSLTPVRQWGIAVRRALYRT